MKKLTLTMLIVLSSTTLNADALYSSKNSENYKLISLELEKMNTLFSGDYYNKITFNSSLAKELNYSKASIKLANEIANHTNLVISKFRENKIGGNFSLKNDSRLEPKKNTLLNWYFEESKKNSKDNTFGKRLSKDIRGITIYCPACECGGFSMPKPSKAAQWLTHYNTTASTLINWGYHSTPSWAGGGYTRPQTYKSWACGVGSFRDHAYVINANVREQNYNGFIPRGEPNPEINTYNWPYPIWPSYVYWWHNTY